ncbi:MAG: RNA polymerase sigma-70 factor [Ferruginibacter sp.]
MANYPTINEKELFLGLSNGNEAAFTQLFVQYSRILFPFVTQLLRSAELSEEIIQQTFLKLWLNREKLADVENPNAYIFRIASNECYAQLRKTLLDEKLFSAIKLNGSNECANVTEEHLTAKEIKQLIQQAVNQLPTQQKRIYNLSRSELLKIPEIAQVLNLSPLTVKNSLVKSLKSIREHLKNSEYYLPVILVIIFS